MHAKSAPLVADQGPVSPTASADVKAEWSEAACPVDPMAAAATATESSIAKPTTSSAKTPNAAAARKSLD
jgi:hypothetical protein